VRIAAIATTQFIPASKAWEAVQKFIVAEARINGLSPERLGEAVDVALTTGNRRHATRWFRSDSRTGLCPDSFLRGWSTRSSQRQPQEVSRHEVNV
jgi:hypothetical protein